MKFYWKGRTNHNRKLIALVLRVSPLAMVAAWRVGVTFEELSAVVNLAFLFRGLSAANYGAEILQSIAKDNQKS